MLIFIAILFWLLINYFTGWLAFNSLLCAFAGLFLIMPSLLRLKFNDFKGIANHRDILWVNLLLNFIFIPTLFYILASLFLSEVYYLKYAFLLLWLLSSWWLVLSWVMKNDWNTKLAFLLFMINFLFFIILFFPLNSFLQFEASEWKKLMETLSITSQFKHNMPVVNQDFVCVFDSLKLPKCLSWLGTSASPIIAFFSIILFPFIISRFIILSKKLEEFISSKIKIISSIATFFIVAYIFSLWQIRSIFSFDLVLVLKVLSVLSIAYLLVYISSFFIYKYVFNSKEGISLFWVSTTRFVTLGLIFSFIYSSIFWYEFLLVFVIAYFVQIIFSQVFSKIINCSYKPISK